MDTQATENARLEEPRGKPAKTFIIVGAFVVALVLLVALNMK